MFRGVPQYAQDMDSRSETTSALGGTGRIRENRDLTNTITNRNAINETTLAHHDSTSTRCSIMTKTPIDNK